MLTVGREGAGQCVCRGVSVRVGFCLLCVCEPVVCFLYCCGATPLRFELVMIQVSVIVTDSEMRKQLHLALMLP